MLNCLLILILYEFKIEKEKENHQSCFKEFLQIQSFHEWQMKKGFAKQSLILFYILCFSILVSIIILTTKTSSTKNNEHDIDKNIEEYYKSASIPVTATLFKSPSILCLIVSSKSQLETRAQIVYKAWARLCDKHFFVATFQPEINNTNIVRNVNYITAYQPNNFTDDQYSTLTHKMYKSIIDMYKMYNNYDWYLKADLDTFVFVNNLKDFLREKDSSAPVYYGYDFKLFVTGGYPSGGITCFYTCLLSNIKS